MPVANGFRMAREIRKSNTKIPIIIASARNEKIFFKNAKEIGTNGYLIKPINFEDLQKELEQIASMHFQKPLVEKKDAEDEHNDEFDFTESIKNLPPLPNSVMEIERLANNPESAIADMIKVIKDDPIATTSILKAVNSPLYGMKDEVKSVDKAISLFGKSTTRALVLSSALDNAFKIDLSPYGISDDLFSEIAQRRTALMIKWYGKVSFSRLNTLATAALLGNIGQVVIAQEIIKHEKVEEFKQMIQTVSVEKAEMVLTGVTSTQITAEILEYWELDEKLINAIKYSEHFDEASDIYKPYAFGCHIVFKLIDILGNPLVEDLPEEIEQLLEAEELKPAHLQKAIDRM
jgi:HD-like signal output (HDOD) protein